jgi:hypothetical protein
MRRADPLTKWILHKIYVDRENCIIKIIGKVQKGKSTISREISWRCLPWLFTILNIIWNPEQFSKRYIDGGGIKRGDPLIYEEIGTEAGGLPRRRWYEFNNLLVIDIFQTHGFEGGVCILNLSSSKYLDSNLEPLIDITIEAKKVDRDTGTNIFTAYWNEFDDETQKVYKHSFLDENGEKIESFAWKRTAPDELTQAYKEAERDFKHWIQERVFQEVKRKRINEQEEDIIFNDLMKDVNSFLIRIRGGKIVISRSLIEDRFKIGNRVAERLKYRAEKKILSDIQYISLKALITSKLVEVSGQNLIEREEKA